MNDDFDLQTLDAILAELDSALNRAKWAARKLALGIDSDRSHALVERVIDCKELLGRLRANEVASMHLHTREEK